MLKYACNYSQHDKVQQAKCELEARAFGYVACGGDAQVAEIYEYHVSNKKINKTENYIDIDTILISTVL